MNLVGLALLATVVGGQMGCAAIKLQDTQAWLGRSVRDLELHPEFSKMHLRIAFHRNGTELRTYEGRVGLTQCSAPTVSLPVGKVRIPIQQATCYGIAPPCHHQFTLDTGKIVAYELRGSCPENESLRPQ